MVLTTSKGAARACGRGAPSRSALRLPVGFDGERALVLPLLDDVLAVRLADAVGRAPRVLVPQQHLSPRVGERRRREPAAGPHRPQRLGLLQPLRAADRTIASSAADDTAPSSQYGVMSPARSGSVAP